MSSYDMPSTSLNTTVSRNVPEQVDRPQHLIVHDAVEEGPLRVVVLQLLEHGEGSMASMSTVSGCRVRRRYSLMKACRRIVRSHPFAFVPARTGARRGRP